jgi:hypothetical protein
VRAKSFDTFCPVGPAIVTRDEIADPQALDMQLRVNGQKRQSGNTAQMVISIPHLVAYHSAQGYSAGDIVTTGTISGVAAVQPDPFEFYLRPGDRIEAEIEGEIGKPVAAPLGQRQHQRSHLAAMSACIDAQVDEVEHHAIERPVKILDGVDPHSEAARRGGLAGDEGQRIGTAFKISERQLIGLCRIGMVHPLRHPPAAGLFARNRRGAFRLRVERLNGDAVVAAGDEPLLEVGTLQHALDQLEPLLAGGLRKVAG